MVTDMQLDKNAKDLHSALIQLIRVYQFRDRDKIQVCCRGLSVTQYYVIAMIVENGPLGIIDLVKRLYLDKSTISRVVDQLVDKDYIKKGVNPKDGRGIRLEVTKTSISVYRQIEIMEINDMKKMLRNIDPKTGRTAIKLISELSEEAREEFR